MTIMLWKHKKQLPSDSDAFIMVSFGYIGNFVYELDLIMLIGNVV